MFYIDVLVFPIYWMHNFVCRNWTIIKRYFYFRGREKIWRCKVGRHEKSLKSTGLKTQADILHFQTKSWKDYWRSQWQLFRYNSLHKGKKKISQ